MTCWKSEGKEFLLPEAKSPNFCVVGTEGELFVDEACFSPADDFDSSGKGESGLGQRHRNSSNCRQHPR
jgi:hypothetical protein